MRVFPFLTYTRRCPPAALEQIAFANPQLDPDHVIAFLRPHYCTKIFHIDIGEQLLEEQKMFFEQTLPSVLREEYLLEKEIGGEEEYAKKVLWKRDFLSRFVQYCTGSHYLPHPDIKTDGDMITIEFNAEESRENSLPVGHTCVHTLKFPHTAYGNDAETLRTSLRKAFKLTSKFGSFGMN